MANAGKWMTAAPEGPQASFPQFEDFEWSLKLDVVRRPEMRIENTVWPGKTMMARGGREHG